jgi:hypothetical protein
MCGIDVIEFFINNIRIEEFKGKRILEVGSKYVNGSVRPLIERFCYQKEYVGIDIEAGKFVDIVLPARDRRGPQAPHLTFADAVIHTRH